MKTTKDRVVALFEELDYKTADKWTAKKMRQQIQKLPELTDDDTEFDEDELNHLLDDLLDAVDQGDEIEIEGMSSAAGRKRKAKTEEEEKEEASGSAEEWVEKKKVKGKETAAKKETPKKSTQIQKSPKKVTSSKKRKSTITHELVEMSAEQAGELLGIREATENDDKSFAYIDADGERKKFVMDRNHENRPFSLSLAKDYRDQMLYGTFAGQWNSKSTTSNGESCVIDWDDNVVSMAHRGAGLWLAEQERQRLVNVLKNGDGDEAEEAKAQLEEYGCNGSITMPTLLVRGVDPACADTSDTGKNRNLADVFFRRAEFGSDLSDSDLRKLATILSVAVKHVHLRVHGYHVKGAPKLHNADAVRFLEGHPLLKEICLFVYQTDKSGETRNPLSRYQLSLGYIAAHIYLAAFMESNAEDFWAGELDLTKAPSKKLFDFAKKFWTDFAAIDEEGKKGTPDVVWNLKTVLYDSAEKKTPLDRDGLCTVTTRAMKAYLVDEKATTNTLRRGVVNRSGEAGFVSEFERFGGIDVETSEEEELVEA